METDVFEGMEDGSPVPSDSDSDFDDDLDIDDFM